MEFNSNKFIKDYKRMCDSFYKMDVCNECPLYGIQGGCNNIENLTEIMRETQKWVEEHPVKTYLMDMKEKFPKLDADDSFYKDCCVEVFYGTNFRCNKDCRDCWNKEME